MASFYACGRLTLVLWLALLLPGWAAAQTLNSFAPASGRPGTPVTITGTNLDQVRSVRFGPGGLSLQFTSQSATSLTVLVPETGASGPLTLTTAANATVSSGSDQFTVVVRRNLTAALSPAGPLDVCQPRTLTAAAFSPAFNPGGTGFNNSVLALAVQPDGKVLVGGDFITYNGGSGPGRLVRLNADGSVDGSFNVGGTGFNNTVNAVAVQADGKVLVGGAFTAYNGLAVPTRLIRLNADGSRDTNFNPVTTGTIGFNGAVNTLVVQFDGKVLVGGAFTTYNGVAATPDYLVRLNADGARDTNFNPVTTGTIGFNGAVNTLAVQFDGKVLVGGAFTTYNGVVATPDYLVRLNADGARDTNFNPVTTGTIGFNGAVNAVAVQADGKVLVGGAFTTYNGAAVPSRLTRLTATGNLDGSFNAGGTGFGATTGTPLVSAVALQADGKLLVGGRFDTYNGSATAPDGLLRLSDDGSPDAGFNASGAGFNSSVSSIAVQADGKLLAGGAFTTYNGSTVPSRLLRLTAGGLADQTATAVSGASFSITPGGTAGSATLTTSTPGTYAATASLDGETALTNTVSVLPCPTYTSFAPASGPAGTPVTITGTNLDQVRSVRFGMGGVSQQFTSQSATSLTVLVPETGATGPLTLTSAGGTGVGSGGDQFAVVVRRNLTAALSPAGPLDVCQPRTLTAAALSPAFNPSGIGFNNSVLALAVQPDGQLLVGGSFSTYNGAPAPYLVRLTATGLRDASFNAGGTGFNSPVTAIAVQADGKVLVGGNFTTYNGSVSNRIVRLNPNGSLDGSFNAGGTGFTTSVNTLAVQTDGKVLVGGSFTAYNGNNAAPDYLLRLNANGSLDASFNSGGAGFNATVSSIAVQADGQVLAGGAFTSYNGNAAAPDYLVRLTTDGSLDAGFNPGGAGFDGAVSTVAVQTSGQVLAGGSFTSYNGSATAPDGLLRLSVDGSLDAGFNAGGAGFNSSVNSIAVQADGKVLAGGAFTTYNGSTVPTGLLRLTATGSLDASFNAGGAGFNSSVSSIAVQADGKVLAGGDFITYNGSTVPSRLLRLTAGELADQTATAVSGASFSITPGGVAGSATLTTSTPGTYAATASLDGETALTNTVSVLPCPTYTSFAPASGPAGTPVTITGTNLDQVRSVRFGMGGLSQQFTSQSATSLTVLVPETGASGPLTLTSAGGTGVGSGGDQFTVVVRRNLTAALSPAGPLDVCQPRTLTAAALSPAFNPGGIGFDESVRALALQPDGQVLAGGNFLRYNGTLSLYLARLTATGLRDASFNAGGTGFNSPVTAIAVQADGKVLVGGLFQSYNNNAAAPDYLVRLNANGSLDASFNAGGAGFNSTVSSIAVQADGKVLVTGSFSTYNGSASPYYLVRLNANGSLDTSFNPGGAGLDNSASTVAVQADGKVLVGGNLTAYNGNNAAPDYLVRLNADGSLDTSFNPGGAGFNGNVNTLAVQADGQVLVGGSFTTYNGSAVPARLVRLNANGSLDAGFNPGGAGFNNNISTLAVQADGQVLVGGSFTTYNGSAVPARLVRLTTDGSRDAGFNPGGAGLSVDFSNGSVNAVVVQTDGKTLAGGYFLKYNGSSVPGHLLRLTAGGLADQTATAVSGASFSITPGGTAGSATLTTSTPGTYAATASLDGETALTNTVSVLPCPTYTSFAPASGPAGTPVTITGTNLDQVRSVRFGMGGVSQQFTSQSGTSLTVLVPETGATGPLTLTSAGGTGVGSGGDQFTVVVRRNLTAALSPAGPLDVCQPRTLTAAALSPAFNPGGTGFNGAVNTLAVQPDGQVLVGGNFTAYNGSAVPARLVRLTATGLRDASYNAGGTGFNNVVNMVVVQPDGKLLVGGSFQSYNNNAAAPDYLVRLNANGSLDGSFNAGGAGFNSAVNTVAVQADGKVLVGGNVTSYNGSAAAPDYLVRLNTDGSLDASFNPGGVGFESTVNTIVVQPDGKLLVGGDFSSYNGSGAAPDRLLRLNADGSLDTSFDAGGAGFNFGVGMVAVQAGGQVLVGGSFTTYNGNAAAPDGLLRLNADGSLDAGFNAGGVGFNNDISTLAVQADGQVLVSGSFTAYNGSAVPARLVRLTATGSLDATFNPGGAGISSVLSALAVQADGKVLAGGYFNEYNGSSVPAHLLRLTAGGLADQTATAVSGASFSITPGGAAGSATLTTSTPGTYTATASLDGETALTNAVSVLPCPTYTSFAPASGPAGTPVTITGTNLDQVRSVRFGMGGVSQQFTSQSATSLTVLVPETGATGPLTLTTITNNTVSSGGDQFAVVVRRNLTAALSPAGPLDVCQPRTLTAAALSPAFNPGGTGFNNSVLALAVLPDGQLLVNGYFNQYNGAAIASNFLARLSADGSLDPGFTPGGAGFNDLVNTVAVQADGKVLAGGRFISYAGTTVGRLLRLTANGSLDASFNPGGSGFNNGVLTLAVQADGRILVSSYSTIYNGSPVPANLMRLNANGSVDASFNPGGAGFNGSVSTLAVQPNGQVLVGGSFTSYNGSPVPANLARLNADGSLDASFNPGGAGFDATVNTLVVQPDGKLLVAGDFTGYNDFPVPPYLVRLNVDGSLDASFNPGGAGFDATVSTVAVQPNGQVLAGGSFTSYNGSAVPASLVRLDADGSLDTGFNPGGLGFQGGSVSTVLVKADGKVLAGGYFNEYNGSSVPAHLLRLTAGGLADQTATAVGGASFSITPGGAAGSATLTTSTPGTYAATASLDGETTAPSNAVELTPCPAGATSLTGLSPAAELPGMAVTLTGTGFTAGSTVTFGGVAAGSVTFTSATSLTAVVPAGAPAGSSAVVVSTNGVSTATSPAFEVLQVYGAAGASGCLSTAPLTLDGTGGPGAWRYLRLPGTGGAVVAAIEDTRNLGTVTAGLNALGTGTPDPVRVDGRAGRRYLDRNFTLTATNASFPNQTVRVRFFGLSSELARLTAADANATLASLNASQYDGPNVDCLLSNNDPNGERRLLPAPATTVSGTNWFVAELAVADHFSEFYLTGASSPLPVQLSSFTATAESRAARLRWTTASEKNSARFDIERSADGRAFNKIGQEQGQGTKASPTSYTFLDEQLPAGTVYYRLRQVDLDGTASYSPVRSVTARHSGSLSLYPNPAHTALTVSGLVGGAVVEVRDALGRTVSRATADATGMIRLALPAGLAPGIYGVHSGGQMQRLAVE